MLSGTDLKIKRIQSGLKAMEIAEKLNVSKSYVSHLERERQEIPLHIYKKWAEVLKLNN